MSKTILVPFSPRDRFAVFVHFTTNVVTNTAREQDEYGELWDSLKLGEIEEELETKRKAGGTNIGDKDFDEEASPVELTKDEIGHFIAFCGRPMGGPLSRMIRPLRIKATVLRDNAGLKPVPAENAG